MFQASERTTINRAEPAPVVLGTVMFGEGPDPANPHALATDAACEEVLRAFSAHGGAEIDGARVYMSGNSEKVLGRVPAAAGLRVSTKYHPWMPGGPAAQLDEALAVLKRTSVSILYIHMPAVEQVLEDTLAEINQCHAAGKFEEFGLCNYAAWQVVEICQYCKRQGYVMPTVYQGIYNALNRTAENELVPVLRNYGIKYYTHGSLAGGFLTGKYKQGVAPVTGVDRFGSRRPEAAKHYEDKFLKSDAMWAALDAIHDAAGAAGITPLEAAVRWTQHHSAVDGSLGDAVLIGVSRAEQVEPIMSASKKGPLPPALVDAFETANDVLKGKSEYYLLYPVRKEGSPWRARLSEGPLCPPGSAKVRAAPCGCLSM